jgi:adenine/guanine phosphoribosyltransferase-like PRPP-binding protein
LRGAQVILVDDVLTSGATSSACVRALKRAGAQRVTIACFARVLDEALPGSNESGPNENARARTRASS